MNFLKKINRGFLLLIVCILIVTIYLVVSGVIQSKDKKEIIALCEEYIPVEVSYSILPEEYRQDGTSMPEEEVSAFKEKMKSDITSYFLDNEESYSNLVDTLEKNITNMSKGLVEVTEYKKTIQKFTDINLDGDKATLTAQCLTKYNGDENTVQDYLALQKVDGKWKMTYSSLSTQAVDYSNYGF